MKETKICQELFISNIIKSMQSNLDKRLPQLVDLIIACDSKKRLNKHYNLLKDIANNNDNYIRKIINKINTNCDKNVVNKICTNFINNVVIRGTSRRKHLNETYNINIPKMIEISYSGMQLEYGNYLLSYETLDKIVKDGIELGIYVYNITSLDNFMQKDLLKIALKNPNCIFIYNINYTNCDLKFLNNCRCMDNIIFIYDTCLEEELDDKNVAKLNDEALKQLQIHKLVFGTKTIISKYTFNNCFKNQYMKKLSNKGSIFNIYSYDVVSLYNDNLNFESINKNINELKQNIPMVFMKSCDMLENKIVIKVNEKQKIQVMDFEDNSNSNELKKSIFDVINYKNNVEINSESLENCQSQKEKRSNIITLAHDFWNKIRRSKETVENENESIENIEEKRAS